MSGRRIQIDVKFLFFRDIPKWKDVEHFQYMTINDGIQAKVLYIYDGHKQQKAIDFVDKVKAKFLSGSTPSKPTTVMSSMPYFTSTVKI